MKIYKWQEVKPIELHSYELVKEYNLNNETLDDTFDWDGEADPEFKLVSRVTGGGGGGVFLQFNGDTGTNYSLGTIYQDGSSVIGAYSDGNDGVFIAGGNSGRKSSTILTGNLKNDGNERIIHADMGRYDPTNTDLVMTPHIFRWENTSSDITSMTLTSTGGSFTGNIQVYKLAKTHLFNQTIYNDTTLNVATTGSNTTGDGSTSKPFASLGGAISWLKNKTINTDVTVTIQFADGTYNNQVGTTIKNIPGRLVIRGNSSNPAAVTLNFAANQAGIVVHGPGASPIFIYDMTLNGYGYAQWQTGILAYYNCVVYLTKVIVNNFGNGVYTFNGAHAIVRNSCVFNGCYNGLTAQNFGIIDADSCTLSNNVNNGIAAQYKGQVMTENCTFTGNSSNTWTATGGVTAIY